MLARQSLQLAENFGAPTRIAALALTKFHILLFLCFTPVLRHIKDDPRTLMPFSRATKQSE
jgi:hypothetical protein